MTKKLRAEQKRLERAGWTANDPAWWTHPKHGGICLENDGRWWAWPLDGGRRGPFTTAIEAAFSKSAWETLRRLRGQFGATRVRDALYEWFCSDANTLGYAFAGVLHLLTKPETEALKVLQNVELQLQAAVHAKKRSL